MYKNIIFQLLLIICLGVGNATEIKFRKVSKEELREEKCSIDKSAHAAYLYKYRKTYLDLNAGGLVTEVHERVKIYDKDGLSHGVREISLFGSEEVINVKGFTYNLVNGEIEEVKFKKEGMFETPVTRNVKHVKLSFPKIKEGSIVEIRYKVVSPYFSSIDPLVLQHRIPIKELHFMVRVLDYFKINKRYKGEVFGQPKISTVNDPRLNIGSTEILYQLKNIPALKSEPFVVNMNNYRAGMEFEVVSVQIPGRLVQNYATTWDAVASTIYENSNFGGQLKKTNYYQEDLKKIIAKAVSNEDKMQKIFEFVQNKMTWNNHSSKYAYDGVKKAYKEGKGNVAEINLMLVSMLKEAGLRAYPVLVSTRKNGVPVFPTRGGFNYVIAAVKIGESYLLLDATSNKTSPNVLPKRVLNWYGRIISETGKSRVIELMPKHKSVETVMLNATLTDEGAVEGKMMRQLTDQYALEFNGLYESTNEENFLDDLEKSYGDMEISEFQVKNVENPKKLVCQQRLNFLKEDMVEEVAGKLYLEPLFFLGEKENPFKSEKRKYPIDYGYPWEDKYIVSIKIPDGYKVESLPKSVALSLPNNLGKFRFQISSTANTIKVMSVISMDASIINTNYYNGLKEFYRSVVEKQTEKVVLTR